MRRYDALWIQRPHFPQALELAHMARAEGVPIIADIDDVVWDVPAGNPFREECPPQCLRDCMEILLFADVCVVSTEALASALRVLGRTKLFVAQNCYPDRMPWRDWRPRKGTVLWRGGRHHTDDMAPYEETIAHVCADKELRFVACGSDAEGIEKVLGEERYKSYPPMALPDLYSVFVEEAPQVIVVPLQAHPFNDSKSDIAAMEAAYAGSLVVAPDLPTWRLDAQGARWPHAIHYEPGNATSLDYALTLALETPQEDVRNRVLAARAWIDANRRNTHAAGQRVKAVQTAVGACV